MALTEQVELLGKGLYGGKIPDILTITAIPTVSELDYVSAEDFDKTMINSILPKCVEEKHIDFGNLLEIDYHWLLRCLRILNYGPYISTNLILCPTCGTLNGDYQCNLYNVDCITLPDGFKGTVTIPRDSFIDFNGDVQLRLLTIQEALNAEKDMAFNYNDKKNLELARYCYMIKKLGNVENVPPVEMKLAIERELSRADYLLLGNLIREHTDFGLRAGGICTCPKCGEEARFLTFINERYFRPSMADLTRWKEDRNRGRTENSSGSKTNTVQKHTR